MEISSAARRSPRKADPKLTNEKQATKKTGGVKNNINITSLNSQEDMPLSLLCKPKVGEELCGAIDNLAFQNAVSAIRDSCVDYKKKIIVAMKDDEEKDAKTKEDEKSELSKVIDKIYDDLLGKYEEEQEKDSDIKLLWAANQSVMKKTNKEAKREMKNKSKTIENEWKFPKISTGTKQGGKAKVLFWDENCEAFTRFQSVKIQIVEKVEQQPSCTYWTKTPVNVLTPDSKYLSHLPYFKEDAEDEFFSRLLDNYDHNLHEEKSEWENKAFFELLHTVMFGLENGVKMVLSRRSETTVKDSDGNFEVPSPDAVWKIEKVSHPSEDVIETIAKALPELGLSKHISIRYVNVCKSMFPSPTTTIDDNDESKDTAAILENEFCTRCCIYGCVSHDKDDNLPAFAHHERESKDQEIPLPTEYELYDCRNEDCLRKETSDKEASKEKSPSFNVNEKYLFKLISSQYPDQYCRIAQLIGTKTCREVFKYSQEAEAAGVAEVPKGELVKAKTKKEKITQWIRHYKSTFESPSDGKKDLYPRYMPCYHPGETCSDTSDCQCYESRTACDKFCGCSISCLNRFPGCTCKGACSTKTCLCRSASRECDPELCDPCQNKILGKSCRNDKMRRGLAKKVIVGRSLVDGYGLFLDEPVSKGDFIIEYQGEKISHDEAERRGAVYDKMQHTFLFNLNDSYVLDATNIGTEARFINSSEKPNCEPKTILIDGDHRLGIFAARSIQQGQELSINYHSVLKQHQEENGAKGGKKEK